MWSEMIPANNSGSLRIRREGCWRLSQRKTRLATVKTFQTMKMVMYANPRPSVTTWGPIVPCEGMFK